MEAGGTAVKRFLPGLCRRAALMALCVTRGFAPAWAATTAAAKRPCSAPGADC